MVEDIDEHVSSRFFFYSRQLIDGWISDSLLKPNLLQEDRQQQKLTPYLRRSDELRSLVLNLMQT